MLLVTQLPFEARASLSTPNLTERPGTSAANERLGVSQAANQRRHGVGSPLIAEHNRRIAEDASAAGPPQRRIAEAAAKRLVVQINQADQVEGVGVALRLKGLGDAFCAAAFMY